MINEQEIDRPSLLVEVGFLFLRLGIMVVILFLVFTFIYGIFRYNEAGMNPAVKDGDIVLYYRLDKNYIVSDTVVVEDQGKLTVRRVAAVEGDTVDITDKGLVINGSVIQEPNITDKTQQFQKGIRFPVKVNKGEVFLLGDAREHTKDSRMYGKVYKKDTAGKVMMILRRRGI